MNLLTIKLANLLIWCIHPSDPKKIELDCLPGWSLVNPFLYAQIDEQTNFSKVIPNSKATFIYNDNFYINTQGFILAQTDSEMPFAWDETFFDEWDVKLYRLVNYFRYASKQFPISPRMKSIGHLEIPELPNLVFPDIGEECATRAWPLKTALEKKDVELVGNQDLSEPPPAFDTMLLDAMEALPHEDYKTAVLLSAISMENLARMKLDEAFASAFVANAKDQPFTIILNPENDIDLNEQRKDELYKLLIRNARFARLLHQSSLILLGKSVCIDDKSLYDRAVKVYNSRNRIAHQGVLPGGDDTRFSGIGQAREAVQCAMQLIDWFGELGGYSNPLDKENGIVFCREANLPNSA